MPQDLEGGNKNKGLVTEWFMMFNILKSKGKTIVRASKRSHLDMRLEERNKLASIVPCMWYPATKIFAQLDWLEVEDHTNFFFIEENVLFKH